MKLKRNQIMITALAIMIAIAGYLNFAGNKIGEETNIAANATNENGDDTTALLDITDDNIASDIQSMDSEAVQTDNYLDSTLTLSDTIKDVNIDTASASLEDGNEETPGEAVYTSTQAISSLSAVKLLKEQTRAKNKETLLEIIKLLFTVK